jgi:hypothetical protein
MNCRATKNVRQLIFFFPPLCCRWIRDRKKLRINDKHPGAALLIASVKGGGGAQLIFPKLNLAGPVHSLLHQFYSSLLHPDPIHM